MSDVCSLSCLAAAAELTYLPESFGFTDSTVSSLYLLEFVTATLLLHAARQYFACIISVTFYVTMWLGTISQL